MRSSLELVTAPSAEPLSLAGAKLHLRVDVTDDDDLITALIVAAREKAEQLTGRALVSQVWRLRLDGFPFPSGQQYPSGQYPADLSAAYAAADILLPRPPLRAVQSLQYIDSNGALHTLFASDAISPSSDGDFDIDYWSEPARLRPLWGKYWPTARTQIGAVVITFEAGYPYLATSPLDKAENVPAAAKAAMKLMIGHWYQHRELASERMTYEVPFSASALLDSIKVADFRLSH